MSVQQPKPQPKLNFWQARALDHAAKKLPAAQQDRFKARVLDRLGEGFGDVAFQVAIEQALAWNVTTK